MGAGVANILIQQGETFRRTILLASTVPCTAKTTSTGFLVGDTTIDVAAYGVGAIAIGYYVTIGTETKRYRALSAIPDVSVGGTLTIDSPLEVPFSATSYKISVYTPIDLTDFVARAMIRPTASSPELTTNFTVTIDADPTSGKIYISLTDLETSAIPTTGERWNQTTKYSWDLEIESIASDVTRVVNGDITVSPEVTR